MGPAPLAGPAPPVLPPLPAAAALPVALAPVLAALSGVASLAGVIAQYFPSRPAMGNRARLCLAQLGADAPGGCKRVAGGQPAEAVPGGVWVVTPEETVRLTGDGKTEVRVKHRSTTSQAWITKF